MSNESVKTRWWENYLVRYFLPSVVGMVILRWLDISVKGSIGEYIPVFLLKEWKDLGTAHLIIWLLFGSLYCYTSSYPILVFHATRVLDFKDKKGTINNISINPYVHSIIFTIIAYIAAWQNSLCIAFIGMLIFFIVQIVRLYKVYIIQDIFHFKQGFEASIAYAYLQKLSKRRGEKENEFVSEDDEGNTVKKKKNQNLLTYLNPINI